MKNNFTSLFSLILLVICSVSIRSLAQRPFVTTWKTDNPGYSNDSSINIPTIWGGYNYDVDWENDGVFDDIGVEGTITHDYGTPGTYTVAIRGSFPRILFNAGADEKKIISIDQWGDIKWESMYSAFYFTSNLEYNATDTPDLSMVTNMELMFRNATKFDGNLSNWDVSNITSMRSMFDGASSFNGNIENWDVSNVTSMKRMFYGASLFNGDLSNWNVEKVTSMQEMFREAAAFNSDLNNWNVENVTTMQEMFYDAFTFDQDLNDWDVSNVMNMNSLFKRANQFNGNIGSWDMSNVTDTDQMFAETKAFNSDISEWDMSNVKKITGMFYSAKVFNSDISSWNIAKIKDLRHLFQGARAFNVDLGSWNMEKVEKADYMLSGCGMSVDNYDSTLIGWGSQGLKSSVSLDANGLDYCTSDSIRSYLINNLDWTIWGDKYDCTFSRIDEVTSDEIFSLFPNPSYGTLYLSVKGNVTNIKELSVIDNLGKTVENIVIYEHSTQNVKIDVQEQGMYYLLIKTDLGTSNQKFVVLN